MIKRALVRYPSYASKEMNNFIQLLLEKNGPKRLKNALGIIENENENGIDSENVVQNGALSKGICYDYLRNHDFFKLGCRCVTYLNSVALLCFASLLCFSLLFALLYFDLFCFVLLYFALSIYLPHKKVHSLILNRMAFFKLNSVEASTISCKQILKGK